jgi:hypothetical protein
VAGVAIRAFRSLDELARRVASLDTNLAHAVGVQAVGEAAAHAPLALDPPSPAPAADLDELPSEATASERRFLYAYFAHVWPGRANVLEVGPFIGGTTRAIALGMLANPRRNNAARLYTYDRFAGYYEPSALADYLAPLFASGALGAGEREVVERAGSFGEVFDAVHRDTPYVDLIERRDKPLPDTPEEVRAATGLFELDEGVEFDAIFVDGCKSWYGTKYFMRAALEAAAAGSHVIFQDYGWFTCFWIPAFVHTMGDAFALTSWVDSTYAFHVVRSVSAVDVDRTYPDTPEELGASWFDEAFGQMRAEASRRGDHRGETVLALQNAAALAYLGETAEARRRILQVRSRARFSALRPTIDAALRTPTYRPGGELVRL